jgi:hypothetical protein
VPRSAAITALRPALANDIAPGGVRRGKGGSGFPVGEGCLRENAGLTSRRRGLTPPCSTRRACITRSHISNSKNALIAFTLQRRSQKGQILEGPRLHNTYSTPPTRIYSSN